MKESEEEGKYLSNIEPDKDLNSFEEKDDRQFFIEIGIKAAENAVNENFGLKMSITYLKDGWVVQETSQGDIKRISEVQGITQEHKFKKGTVWHVKKG
jgi:hypothetical protein